MIRFCINASRNTLKSAADDAFALNAPSHHIVPSHRIVMSHCRAPNACSLRCGTIGLDNHLSRFTM